VLWAGEEWYTIEQLGRHVGGMIDALDAMSALADAGLIHRQGRETRMLGPCASRGWDARLAIVPDAAGIESVDSAGTTKRRH
jgi:hypothetical protein